MHHALISVDPSNGDPLGEVEVRPAEDIPVVVARAQEAAVNWRTLGMDQRVRILEEAYSRVSPHVQQLATLLSREMGKDIRRAIGETQWVVQGGPELARSAREALQPQQLGGTTRLEYRPLGVVAVISPWNYLLAMANNLLVPALVAGNTVVLKPRKKPPWWLGIS